MNPIDFGYTLVYKDFCRTSYSCLSKYKKTIQNNTIFLEECLSGWTARTVVKVDGESVLVEFYQRDLDIYKLESILIKAQERLSK